MTDVTQILSQIEQGDPSAAEQLLPLVYDELRKLAAAKLANEKPGQCPPERVSRSGLGASRPSGQTGRHSVTNGPSSDSVQSVPFKAKRQLLSPQRKAPFEP